MSAYCPYSGIKINTLTRGNVYSYLTHFISIFPSHRYFHIYWYHIRIIHGSCYPTPPTLLLWIYAAWLHDIYVADLGSSPVLFNLSTALLKQCNKLVCFCSLVFFSVHQIFALLIYCCSPHPYHLILWRIILYFFFKVKQVLVLHVNFYGLLLQILCWVD